MSRTILLTGTPSEVGRCVGELAGPVLRGHIQRMWDAAAAAGLGAAGLDERGERLRAFVERVAPEWLDEAEATAAAAGVNAADLFALNALPRGFWEAERGGCTSCLVVGSQSATGSTLLHKNRDLLNAPQDFHLRRLADGAQVLASRDIGNLGFGHFHSDRALAGANNTGSCIAADEIRDCGISDCHLLRLVAERAASCDEAVALLEDAIAREVAGGSGASRGMIFLFAEPAKGVLVEMTSRRLAVREVRDETLVRTNHFLLDAMRPVASEPPTQNSLRRFARAQEILDPLETKNLADLQRMARDHNDGPDSICSSDREHLWMTVSACTHVVRADNADPRAHTRALIGNPRNTLAIPIPRAIDGLPEECVDCSLHDLSRELYARFGVGDHLADVREEYERPIAAEFGTIGAAVQSYEPGLQRRYLTALVARSVERVRATLEGLLE